MPALLQRVVESTVFHAAVLCLILLAAVLVGLETDPGLVAEYGDLMHSLDAIVLWLFALEAALKMGQHGRKFGRYFHDPWNLFDFTIVVVCFLPVNAQYAAVLRLARIVRALRLVTAVPKLQLLVGALLKSIPSMFYVGLLLLLLFYVYGVTGVFLWRDNDPVHFRDLPTSMLSLFRVVTLEDWTDIMYIQMYGSDVYAYDNTSGIAAYPSARPVAGAMFFVSFVMLGTMIMLNLFIGVILSSMAEAQDERQREHQAEKRALGTEVTVVDEVTVIEQRIDDLKRHLNVLRLRLENGAAPRGTAVPDETVADAGWEAPVP